MSYGPAPWQQTSWDWRAASNFMAGGAGSGLIVAAFLAGAPRWLFAAGALIVSLGLLAVWAEIGRPWRALNVFRQARRSWMTREALVAPPLLAAALAAAFELPGAPALAALAALLALAFAYCQGRILQAARGIPAWRSRWTAALIVATALAEGAALCMLLAGGPATLGVWGGLALALVARIVLWNAWRTSVVAAPRAHREIDRAGRLVKAATLLPLAAAVLVALAPMPAAAGLALQWVAATLALAGGLAFKWSLVTRAGFNQGFALPHLPVRGARHREV